MVRNLVSSTTHGSVNWYSVWRSSLSSGFTRPMSASATRPAAVRRAGWLAIVKTASTNWRVVRVSAMGRCQICPLGACAVPRAMRPLATSGA